MKMENSDIALFLISFLVLTGIFFFTPYLINKYIIKKKLLRQERAIQTQFPQKLLTAEHVFGIEFSYIMIMMWCSAPFIIGILFHIPGAAVNEMIRQLPFHVREDHVGLLEFLAYYIIVLLLFCLFNLLALYVRKALGKIQGAVLFDPQEKKVFVFPSIDSDNYKEYCESELTYTTEFYSTGGRGGGSTAYVFFTQKDNNFAFKVDNLHYNNFEAILSQQEAIDMPIPFKHGFHTFIFTLIALAIFIFGIIVILPLVR